MYMTRRFGCVVCSIHSHFTTYNAFMLGFFKRCNFNSDCGLASPIEDSLNLNLLSGSTTQFKFLSSDCHSNCSQYAHLEYE